jgi:regulatory protein
MKEKEIQKAENYLIKILSYRPRTVLEVERKLKMKGFSEEVIKDVVEKAKNLGYLNDSRFVEEWIRYRKNKKFGNLRIKEELINLGISRETIEENLKEDDDFLTCVSLLKQKAKNLRNNFNQKRKIFNFLKRRGFSTELIKKAFKEINEEIVEEVV